MGVQDAEADAAAADQEHAAGPVQQGVQRARERAARDDQHSAEQRRGAAGAAGEGRRDPHPADEGGAVL